jgi:multidrug efflux pump subunit AcrA (membrane-fusion protein)
MSDLAPPLPGLRPDLIFSPAGQGGGYVIKNPRAGDYFNIGEEEHFLLTQCDGEQSAESIRARFAERFGQPLEAEELDEFLGTARKHGLLRVEEASDTTILASRATPTELSKADGSRPRRRRVSSQGLLAWRINLFDPDRFLNWAQPRLWFFWTRGFVVFSAGCIVLAAVLIGLSRERLAVSFVNSLRWETAALGWLTLLAVTTLHEFAHGLTCKRHGGAVQEVGFLMLLLMPCFYCNVSDAWLFREKSQRLWVTFAGAYFELFLWSLAVFVWRLTLADTLVHDLAFLVLSACGLQTLFNLNPLIKLDGYYFLSDWLEVPNLQQRAWSFAKGWLRRLLWGAARPAAEPRGRLLLTYGLISFLYSAFFLALMLGALVPFLWRSWGWPGLILAGLLCYFGARGLFKGLANGEVRTMIATRRRRTTLWLLALGCLAAVLTGMEIEDRVGGSFRLRPAVRAEIRAPVAGFLTAIPFDEGDRVSSGEPVARIDVPGLASRLAQKRAEGDEARARLRLLEIGPRPEEVAEHRRRLDRAQQWRDLARDDLKRTQLAFERDLDRLDKQVAARRAELDAAADRYHRDRALVERRAIAAEELREAEEKYLVGQAHLAEADAAHRAAQAKGTIEAEAEVARREKELAEAGTALRLLKAGSRPEEIAAQRARLAGVEEEIAHLEEQHRKQDVFSPMPGLITTPRLKEKVGQYLREGDLIGVVESRASLELEIALAEQDAARVRPGQSVRLKVRALPYETFATVVDRVASSGVRGEAQSSVTVYSRLDPAPDDLRTEMTGYARIETGRRPIGAILIDRMLRLVRTEFWW